jgi:hypothetical protein
LPLPDELLCHLFTVCALSSPTRKKDGKMKRLKVNFNYSVDDLQVCAAEEVSFDPVLLEKFIQSCDRDIRKAIMHLQFWFQNKKHSKGNIAYPFKGKILFN